MTPAEENRFTTLIETTHKGGQTVGISSRRMTVTDSETGFSVTIVGTRQHRNLVACKMVLEMLAEDVR